MHYVEEDGPRIIVHACSGQRMSALGYCLSQRAIRKLKELSPGLPAISSSVSSFRTAARLASRANFLNISCGIQSRAHSIDDLQGAQHGATTDLPILDLDKGDIWSRALTPFPNAHDST